MTMPKSFLHWLSAQTGYGNKEPGDVYSYQTLHVKSNEWIVKVEINLESFSLIENQVVKINPPPILHGHVFTTSID